MKPVIGDGGEYVLADENEELKEKVKTLSEEYETLRKENKSLKSELNIASNCSYQEEDGILQLKKTNDSLVLQLAEYKNQITDLKSELNKFSESYKKYRDYEKEELAESCYDLSRENNKLKGEKESLYFDINGWKGLKKVWEEKEKSLESELNKLKEENQRYKELYQRG